MNERVPIPHDYLSHAVAAARKALLRLEIDDVPAPLKRVAASSARRLPPPLLVSLLDYLDESAWLRERAHEAWPEADVEVGDPQLAISALYLLRPDGWEDRCRDLASAAEQGVDSQELAHAQREIRRLERVVSELERRLDDAQSSAESARRDTAAELKDRIDRWEALARRARVEREAALIELERMTEQVERLTTELDEADQRIEELRLRRERRRVDDRQGLERGFGRGDGLSVAQDLDRLMETLRVDGGTTPPGDSEMTPILPSGVRPDEVAAIEWLLSQPLPLDVLVDGHNVAHDLASPPDVLTRRKVEEGLVRLRRLAAAPLRVHLFWDTTTDEDRLPVRGLDVRYVESADDAIVEEVDAVGGSVVVVSTDGELRDRAARRGVLSIWGTALSEWLQRR